jgi:hypothetical protein
VLKAGFLKSNHQQERYSLLGFEQCFARFSGSLLTFPVPEEWECKRA